MTTTAFLASLPAVNPTGARAEWVPLHPSSNLFVEAASGADGRGTSDYILTGRVAVCTSEERPATITLLSDPDPSISGELARFGMQSGDMKGFHSGLLVEFARRVFDASQAESLVDVEISLRLAIGSAVNVDRNVKIPVASNRIREIRLASLEKASQQLRTLADTNPHEADFPYARFLSFMDKAASFAAHQDYDLSQEWIRLITPLGAIIEKAERFRLPTQFRDISSKWQPIVPGSSLYVECYEDVFKNRVNTKEENYFLTGRMVLSDQESGFTQPSIPSSFEGLSSALEAYGVVAKEMSGFHMGYLKACVGAIIKARDLASQGEIVQDLILAISNIQSVLSKSLTRAYGVDISLTNGLVQEIVQTAITQALTRLQSVNRSRTEVFDAHLGCISRFANDHDASSFFEEKRTKFLS